MSTAMRKVAAAAVAVQERGEFTALVASYGTVDRANDRIVYGAFAKSLERWRASDRRVPIVWSHEVSTPSMIVGSANPADCFETELGLWAPALHGNQRSAQRDLDWCKQAKPAASAGALGTAALQGKQQAAPCRTVPG